MRDAVLVDVGAGEGYLSSAVSELLRLPLVGLDCSESNVHGAQSRSDKIVQGLDKRDAKHQRLNSHDDDKDKARPGVVHVRHTLTRETTEKELLALVNGALHAPPDAPRSLILLGLHACGELCATSFRLS